MLFNIYGHDGRLGHVTGILQINFRSPYTWMLRINFPLICQAVSEKKVFEKCVCIPDRPRSRDDLELNQSHTFNYSISCLHLPLSGLRLQLFKKKKKKKKVFTFSPVKAFVSKIDRVVKVSLGSSFDQTIYNGLES